MNTKNMRLPPRRFLTPSKRKERDGFINAVKPSITMTTPPPPTPTTPSTLPNPPPPSTEQAKSNDLLAGYLAHEFLSKGTLFGQPFDPAVAEEEEEEEEEEKEVMSSQKAEMEPSRRGGGGGRVEPGKKKECERYADISGLLKREGAYVQGIVNPTQLAHFLQM